MADRFLEPDTPELRARWGGFAFNAEWDAKARAAIARYPEGRQRSGQDLLPHRSVDVVQHRDLRAPAPDRREPRDAVPDLDQRVVATHPPEQLGGDRPGEHRVPAPPPHDVVPVAPVAAGQPDRRRRAVQDVEPGGCPSPHELVGVHLGASGVGIVEIAPCQHVDAPDPSGAHVLHVPLERRLLVRGFRHPGRH